MDIDIRKTLCYIIIAKMKVFYNMRTKDVIGLILAGLALGIFLNWIVSIGTLSGAAFEVQQKGEVTVSHLWITASISSFVMGVIVLLLMFFCSDDKKVWITGLCLFSGVTVISALNYWLGPRILNLIFG